MLVAGGGCGGWQGKRVLGFRVASPDATGLWFEGLGFRV